MNFFLYFYSHIFFLIHPEFLRAVWGTVGHLPHPGGLLPGAHPQPGGGGGHRPNPVRRPHLPFPQPPDPEGGGGPAGPDPAGGGPSADTGS